MSKFDFPKKIAGVFLDILFPSFCAGCGQEGVFLCDPCEKGVAIFNFAVCANCRKKLTDDKGCRSCRGKTKLKGLWAAAYYENRPIRNLIALLKYRHARQVTQVFQKWILEATRPANFENFVVMPVPLHKKRLYERGFNQAEILAQTFARAKKLEFLPVLKKTKPTRPQTELTGDERKENLDSAFECKEPEKIAKRKILLIDDVCTTGATLNECAKTLKEAGAREVWGLVVAR